MSNSDDKQYCSIDHANKQRDRKRGYPTGRTPAKGRSADGQSGVPDKDGSESASLSGSRG
jgi:hypothetical protein